MGQSIHILKPVGGIQTDAASEAVKPTEVRYALNMERTINNNESAIGKNSEVSTPSHANQLLDFPGQPAGINTVIGRCISKKTNEVYCFVHNSDLSHHIYRINGKDNSTTMVLMDPKLNFSLFPRHQIKFRAYLYFIDQPARNGVHLKYITWTDGFEWQGFLDVETSIATNGFRIPYFNCPDRDRTQLWQLPTRPCLQCITGDFEINKDGTKTNRIANNLWQFRVKFVYYDGRQTSWSPIPTAWVNLSACQVEGAFDPRCINLRICAGGPQVEKIILAYRNCIGSLTTEAATSSDWYQTDIINKYEDCLGSDQLFYERKINPNLSYDAATNTIIYKFCNEGTCIPIAKAETDANYIPIPKTSYGLMPIEDKLALLNNEDGDNPIDCRVAGMFSYNPSLIESAQTSEEQVTIKVGIIIHQMFRDNNALIYVNEDPGSNDPAAHDGLKKFFGGLSKLQSAFPLGNVAPYDETGPYDQYFGDTSKDAGFIAYVEGTGAFGVSKQYRVFPGGAIEGTPFQETHFSSNSHRKEVAKDLKDDDYYFMSIAEIKVPKGTKGYIRLASHLAKPSDNDFRATSTNVWGILYNRGVYHSNHSIEDGETNILQKEIEFDTCGGPVAVVDSVLDLTMTPFIIADLTAPYGDASLSAPGGRTATAFTGYAQDTEKRPVPKAAISNFGTEFRCYTATFTDHNGYFFMTADYRDVDPFPPSTGLELYIEGSNGGSGCARILGGSYTLPGGAARPDQTVRTPNIVVGDENYGKGPDFMQQVLVRVLDPNGVPVAGVPVAVSRQKYQTTNSQGEATFLIRRYIPFYPTAEQIQFIVMQSTGCLLINDAAPGCMPDPKTWGYGAAYCFRGNAQFEIIFPQLRSVQGEYGYAPGGVYPMAYKLIDAAGRETFAEKTSTVRCPEMQQAGKFGLYRIGWQFSGSANFPREYRKMALLIAANTAWSDMITWVADKVQYVDSTGLTASPDNAAKILVSIQSLFDYNVFYGENTTARYGFTPGDRLQILTDKDGKLYSTVFDYLIESSTQLPTVVAEGEGRYTTLVIAFDKNLKDFDKGSLIKIYKQRVCKTEEFYYEVCDLIDLVDGEPVVKSGTIGGYDSYLIRRGIAYDDMVHTFSFPFLHHSPSDHWGDHCVSRGRVSVVNQYSRRVRNERQMKISGAFIKTGFFNGLNLFSNSLKKEFSGEQRGGIVAAVWIEKLFMCICEHDNFIAQTADQFVTVDQRTGQLQALPGDAIVSDGESKIVGNFGCQYDDVGSIIAGDGFVSWVDTYNKAPVLHDWNTAKDASLNKTQGYFVEKLKYVYGYNMTAPEQIKIRIQSGFDSIGKNILFTFFNPLGSFVHSRHQFSIPENETIALSIIDGTFPTMYGFTPENYAEYDNSILGDLFITFKNGKPWLHRVLALNQFNTFFGEGSDQVWEPVLNERPEKVKILVAMQQISNQAYYLDRILTSNGHQSELPSIWVKKRTEGKYDAEFLQASNRNGGLYNGPSQRGHWIQLRFVRDNTFNYLKGVVDVNKQAKYSELDRIILKCAVSEQSAYNT